jgi:hypothetical protein
MKFSLVGILIFIYLNHFVAGNNMQLWDVILFFNIIFLNFIILLLFYYYFIIILLLFYYYFLKDERYRKYELFLMPSGCPPESTAIGMLLEDHRELSFYRLQRGV